MCRAISEGGRRCPNYYADRVTTLDAQIAELRTRDGDHEAAITALETQRDEAQFELDACHRHIEARLATQYESKTVDPETEAYTHRLIRHRLDEAHTQGQALLLRTPGGTFAVRDTIYENGRCVLEVDLARPVTRRNYHRQLHACYWADDAGKQVTVVKPSEFAGEYKTAFTTADGRALVGVKHDGEIGALCSTSPVRG